ncbi:MAG: SdpI family protein [Candidatus Eisenbacteria bacterium]|nr:SdpI family protein [Candidatus Eisenbacteria bacterium]
MRWTLTSRLAWDRSHRLGSKLFMGAGLLFIAAGIIGKPWALGVAVGGTVMVTIITVGYSYVIWKGDPNRVPPG